MKVQFVCGTFDEENGHVSTLGKHISDGLSKELDSLHIFNGGNIDVVQSLRDASAEFDSVIWMPNISNTVSTKYVDKIKKLNKKCILVVSKRNDGGKYSLGEIINRALKKHANLILEVKSGYDTNASKSFVYVGRLLDPLGNVFCNWTDDFYKLGEVIGKRIKELHGFTRFGSTRVGDAIDVPDEGEFFKLVREKAGVFQKLVPSVQNPSRFLGNASFRCQRGFPSFRHGEYIFVSRRNVDKEHIDQDGFVAVKSNTIPVEYFGDHKPSVDTPTQLMLYQAFPKVNYILHGHVYLFGFRTTEFCIPCGAIEEAHEIKKRFGHEAYVSFGINLKGHGFLAASDSVEQLRNMVARLKPRPIPEACEMGHD